MPAKLLLHCQDSGCSSYLMLLPEELACLLELSMLGQQVVLLQPNDRAWPANPDVPNRLLRSEVMVLDEIAADEHPRAPQPCLAVNGQRPCIIVSCCCSALNLHKSTLCIVCLNAHVKLLITCALTLRLFMPPQLICNMFLLMLQSPTHVICLYMQSSFSKSRPSQWNAA